MAQIPAASYLTKSLWDTAVTMMAENQCICAQLYKKTTEDGQDDGIICVDDRQDVRDPGNGRGSDITYYFADRYRGQEIGPKPLGATAFGQFSPQRPTWKQNMVLRAQELATTGFFALEIGQTYSNIPLHTKELQACGAEAAEIICRSVYYHLSGLTAYNTATYSPQWQDPPCGNLVRELDAAHRFFCGGETTDAGVAGNANAILTMEFLEQCITSLQDRSMGVISPFVPGWTPWGEWFVFICDFQGLEQLTRHSSTNRVMSLTLAEIQAGNDIDKVASFMHANQGFAGTRKILVLPDAYTPFGQSGSTSDATTAGTQIGHVRRGMLLGRLAMKMIWGQGFDSESSRIRATSFTMHEQQDWKLLTHWGGTAIRPTDHTTPQRMGSATVAYYTPAVTPTY